MSVVKHTTILTATIDRGHNKATTNRHVRLIDECMEVGIRRGSRILHVTTTSTEYEAYVNGTVATIVLHTLSSNLNRTYLATADYDGTLTGICFKCLRLTTKTTIMGRMSCWKFLSFSYSSNGTHQTTTIDTVKDIAASHSDIGVAEHISSTTTAIDVTITDSNLFCTFSNWSISPFTSLIGTDINLGITFVGNLLATCYIGILTTTKDITGNVSTFGVMRIGAVNCNSCRNILTTCCSDRVTIRIKNLS